MAIVIDINSRATLDIDMADAQTEPFSEVHAVTNLGDVIEFVVACRREITDRELSEAIYGTTAKRTVINRECQRLVRTGTIERRNGVYAVVNSPGHALGLLRNRKRRITDTIHQSMA